MGVSPMGFLSVDSYFTIVDWQFSNSLIIHTVISQSDCPTLVRRMHLKTQ